MIAATLIGGGSPQMVQIVVSATSAGVPWTVVGSAGDRSWTVPGGEGIGNGGQLTLADNRAPGNQPVVYTYTAGGASQSSSPITIPFASDFVLQSLNGARSLALVLSADSLDTSMESGQQVFRVAGRRRPVVRYDVTAAVEGTFNVEVTNAQAADFHELIGTGEPLLYRLGTDLPDIEPVGVITYGRLSSRMLSRQGRRIWVMPYALIDDPYLDVRLGAFSWDDVEAALAGRTWDQIDALMATYTWDQIDAFDWSTI
ncbi:hypothetical protein [Streptomyces sp. AC495_CC817]|uniref:hypothetical protein n=1 Tax=Streptomyces sp. AC495_CC817 TaxID=2823900 RepID=UPI001C276E5D|nr:hypothetical protein [Streptomyces sp. AC495_CC817]